MFEFIKPASLAIVRPATFARVLAGCLLLATAGFFWLGKPRAEEPEVRQAATTKASSQQESIAKPVAIEPGTAQAMSANINARIEGSHAGFVPRKDFLFNNGKIYSQDEAVLPQETFTTSQPPRTECPATVSPGNRDEIIAFAKCQAIQRNIPDHIVLAVIEIESNFNWAARGDAGEIGLMQVMPPTARMLGFSGTLAQLADPKTNIKLGTRYLAEGYHLAKRDLCTTVMKYRAGHGERRFSVRSVNYCKRARNILAREGHEVTGTLPKPTFGFETGASGGGRASIKSGCLRKNFTPGPRYGTCLRSGSGAKARNAARLRRKLFN